MSVAAVLPAAGAQRRRSLSHALFAALLLAYVAVFHTSLLRLAEVWAGDGTFQFAFLIPPISLFLVWERRHRLAGVPFAPSALGAAAIFALSLLWMLGELAGVQQAQQIALVALLPAMVIGVYGWQAARALLFPLAYLFFAVPWPVEHLITVLQHITAVFAVKTLQLTGFTVYLDGVLIETPVSVWHVADACSGIKFFIAMVALSLLYAQMFFHSRRRRLIFVALAFIVPIVANGLRVYFTIVIGEVFGVQYATGTDHMIFGWQFFGTVLLLYFLAGWPFREPPPPEPAPAPPAAAPPPALVLRWAPALMLCLLAGPIAAFSLVHAAPRPAPAPPPPERLGTWRLDAREQDVLGAHFHRAARLSALRYAGGTAPVYLVEADYPGPPRHGRKLFMVGNHWYDRALWQAQAEHDATLKLPSGRALVLREAVLNGPGQRLLAWYWYAVDGRPTTSVLQAKLWQLQRVLSLRPLDTRITVVATPYRYDRDAARARLSAFTRALAAHGGGGA